MATCPACKATQPDGARFCAQCGGEIPLAGPATPEPAPFGAPPTAQGPKTSGLAVAALVLAIIPCTWVIGLVLGIVALVRINGRPRELKGQGLAIAALIVPAIWFVVGILAAIAIPSFMKYQSRAKQTEARMNLRQIYSSEKSFEAEKGEAPKTFAEMGFEPEPHRRYAYFFDGDAVQPDLGGPYQVPPELAAQAQGPGVVAIAVGNIDDDPTLDVWIVDGSGQLTALRDDTRE